MLQPIDQGFAVLVDRNGFQRKLLRSLLRSSGFERVTEYNNLETGLDEAQRVNPDFFFLDFDTAAQSDLFRAQQNFKQSYFNFNTHLIFMLDNATHPRVKRAIASGAHWVLSRPFSPNSLNQRLNAILRPPKSEFPAPSAPTPTEETGTLAAMTRQMKQLEQQLRKLSEDDQDNQNSLAKERIFRQLKKLEQDFHTLAADNLADTSDKENVLLI